jgi:hypothetical protein
MSDRTQIGPTVDAGLWREFRENVKERMGHTRGALGDELENAIREYIRDESRPVDRRVEKRLARIEEAVGAAPTDGGTDTVDAGEHTHAPSRLDVTEKPSANAATDKKVAYLAECIREETGSDDPQELPRSLLVDVVKDEYGFRSDTAERYVGRLVDHFDLRDHPTADPLLVSETRYREIVEQEREQRKDDVEAELETL